MNINFHYFCIKTLAVTAGFAPDDAQTLAAYSQFVDDFDKSNPMLFKTLPAFIQNSALAKEIKIGPHQFWLFQPVPTGFPTWYDTALLSLPQNQTNIVTPFHSAANKIKPKTAYQAGVARYTSLKTASGLSS